MGQFGTGNFTFFLIYAALVIVPFWKIFPRAGWNPYLSLLMVIPPVNLIMLWVLAFKRWQGDTE